MDLLYRLFYTAFSMAVVTAFMMPVILVFRLLLLKAPRKYIVYIWLLYFSRGICPVSLSSPFCISSKWNREFHMLLPRLGLVIDDNSGIMKGWRSVFVNEVHADKSYMACTIIWCAGMACIMVFTFMRQVSVSAGLRNAGHIYGNIYQSDTIESPVITGIFFLKKYLPSGMKVNDIKYLLQHFEAHSRAGDGIKRFFAFIVVVVQWFNPFMWIAYYLLTIDIEIAADEAVARKNGGNSANGFAQELFNIKGNSFKGRQTLLLFNERYTEKRAYRLIYMVKGKRRYTLLAFIVLLLCFTWAFLLRPLQIWWNGGTWGAGGEAEEDGKLFDGREEVVVASLDTVSPSGLGRVLQLVMTSGSYEEGKGYTGSFGLKLNDAFGTGLDKKDISYIFNDVPDGELYFKEKTELSVYDYNADGTNELVIGQQADVTGKRWKEITGKRKRKNSVLKEYYVWNIEETSLEKVSGAIYDTSRKEAASCQFGIPEETTRVFTVKLSGKDIYYVWNDGEGEYQQKELTEDELIKYRTDYTGVESTEGERNTHTLESDGTTYVEIETQKDTTGNEIIKKIVLNPGRSQREMPLEEGYYCDIQWASSGDKRYAMLIYNGLNARTFTIYDLDRQKVYYAHEDGNSVIASVFNQYNNTGIGFNEENPAVYRLMDKDGDNLEIGFAANTKDGIAINGSYIYNTVSESINNFSYSQNSG